MGSDGRVSATRKAAHIREYSRAYLALGKEVSEGDAAIGSGKVEMEEMRMPIRDDIYPRHGPWLHWAIAVLRPKLAMMLVLAVGAV